MLVSALTFFAAIALTRQHEVEIPVTNVSAGYLLDFVTGQGRIWAGLDTQGRSLLPDGVTVRQTIGKNSLTFSGSAEQLKGMEHFVSQIDIAPPSVELDIHVYARPLDRTIEATMTMTQFSTWEYVEDMTETTIRITPRINGDGTIVIGYDLGTMGFGLHGIVRFQAGRYVYARVYTEEIIDEATGEMRLALIISHSASRDEIPSFLELDDPFNNSPHYRYIHGGPAIQSPYGFSSRSGQPIDHTAYDLSVKNPPAGLDIRLKLVAKLEKAD